MMKEIQSQTEGDEQLWTSNVSPVARLFQNKVMFLSAKDYAHF